MEDQKNVQTDSLKNIFPANGLPGNLPDGKPKDLKTTISGTIAAVATALATVPGPHLPIAAIVAAVAGSLFAFWSKDR